MESVNECFFDVVGIAASAGGFKPIIEIISNLPADFPATVLLVQHLSPQFKSLMPEILSQRTSLEVKEAKGGRQAHCCDRLHCQAQQAPGGET